jgi:hypothetical protein
MTLATRHVGSIGVSATGTREPALHGGSSPILARRQIMIRLQLRNQPSTLVFGELADLVEDFLKGASESPHETRAYRSDPRARPTSQGIGSREM